MAELTEQERVQKFVEALNAAAQVYGVEPIVQIVGQRTMEARTPDGAVVITTMGDYSIGARPIAGWKPADKPDPVKAALALVEKVSAEKVAELDYRAVLDGEPAPNGNGDHE